MLLQEVKLCFNEILQHINISHARRCYVWRQSYVSVMCKTTIWKSFVQALFVCFHTEQVFKAKARFLWRTCCRRECNEFPGRHWSRSDSWIRGLSHCTDCCCYIGVHTNRPNWILHRISLFWQILLKWRHIHSNFSQEDVFSVCMKDWYSRIPGETRCLSAVCGRVILWDHFQSDVASATARLWWLVRTLLKISNGNRLGYRVGEREIVTQTRLWDLAWVETEIQIALWYFSCRMSVCLLIWREL